MMNQIEDVLISLASKKTSGYGPRPIPHEIDDEVHELIRYFREADPDELDTLFLLMTERHGLVLLAFAERMAALAVRMGDSESIREGLAAVAFASHLTSWKEATMVLSLLYRSLEKLNVEPSGFFAEVAGVGEEKFDKQLRGFPGRNERDRSVEIMNYIESADKDGFRYIYKFAVPPKE